MNVITREDLKARLAANPKLVLLEALPVKYYDEGHLPGAKHFPHDQARQLAPAIIPDKASEVVVYCASQTCQNSHIAANVLRQAGYASVAVYGGGKQDWVESGAALEAAAVA